MLGFIHFQSVNNIFTFIFLTFEVLKFLKKIVFSGRQKSVGAAILFDKFSFADFCYVRHNSNKFGSTLTYRKIWLVRWAFRATWQCVWMRRGWGYSPFTSINRSLKVFSPYLNTFDKSFEGSIPNLVHISL